MMSKYKYNYNLSAVFSVKNSTEKSNVNRYTEITEMSILDE